MVFLDVASRQRRGRWDVNVYNVYPLAVWEDDFCVDTVLVAQCCFDLQGLPDVCCQPSSCAVWTALFY